MLRSTAGNFEELVLLAIQAMGEGYCSGLTRYFKEQGRETTVGHVQTVANRMAEKEWLESWESEPSKYKGGRRKRMYKLTPLGESVLRSIQGHREILKSAPHGAR